MTITAPPKVGSSLPRKPAPALLRLIRAELLKIRTTNAWWVFGLCALGLCGFTLMINALQAHFLLDNPEIVREGLSGEELAQIDAYLEVPIQAANLYTSGQLLVLIVVMVAGVMLMTNEFHHQTVTTTFLATPRRTKVILAKVMTAVILGGYYWALTTALNIPITAIFLRSMGYQSFLSDPAVLRAIFLNLLAYVLWAIFGLGLGILLRSQIVATVTSILLYLAGFIGAMIIFSVLAEWLDAPWILKWQVIVPSLASQLMVAGTDLPGNPPQWLGAVVLVGWAAVASVIGVLLIRKRDIS